VGLDGLVAPGIAGCQAQIELAAAGRRQGKISLNLAAPVA
jgi:hypothetical protein